VLSLKTRKTAKERREKTKEMKRSLCIFGFGYTANYLAALATAQHFEITGTSRSKETRNQLQTIGYKIVDFAPDAVVPLLHKTTHLLISTPLDKNWQDPVLTNFENEIRKEAAHLEWIGYLSTTGVYGDHQGAWIDESTTPNPSNERAAGRRHAETQWLALGEHIQVPTHVFRLAGIYGPRRNALRALKEGNARPIYKEGQVFSRIHVEDIARILVASMNHPQGGNIYNVCDDLPAPSHEIIEYAAEIMQLPKPERIPFAQANLSEMGKEFYESSRRVRNDKVKKELGIMLKYPTYREGLNAMLVSGGY
jgi:dTDP-4-dehydrorhamnose reductase